jgi:hypothetical protein
VVAIDGSSSSSFRLALSALSTSWSYPAARALTGLERDIPTWMTGRLARCDVDPGNFDLVGRCRTVDREVHQTAHETQHGWALVTSDSAVGLNRPER